MKNIINTQYYKTPFGELILGSFEGCLCLCDWQCRVVRDRLDQRIQKGLQAVFVEKPDDVIDEAKRQMKEYFNIERTIFDLPLLMIGTDFQKKVWSALLDIPYGETSSYLGLAKSIDNDKAVRAVGTANGANAISIIIPCHRVIASDGGLGGYAGGLKSKEALLTLEAGRQI